MTRDEEALENHSRRLRVETGVDDRFCADVLYVAYRLQELGWISAFKRLSDAEMPRAFAYYSGKDEILYIADGTFVALDQPGNVSKVERRRHRFTLAHEFEHVLQRPVGDRYRGAVGALAYKVDPLTRRDEIYANRFASSFLVPAHLARWTMTPEHLSELFDVNISVARYRRDQLERLHRRASGSARKLPDGIVDLLEAGRRQGFKVRSLDAEMERRRKEAIATGYLPDACNKCGKFTLKHENGHVKCETCSKAGS